jgi:hypothetical protein
MKRFAPVNKPAEILSLIVGVILVLLPFHAFLTVWLSSLIGHYTLLRLWKEVLLVVLLAGSLYILVTDKKLLRIFRGSWLVRLIFIYSAVLLIWGFVALANHNVTGKAMWYGLLVNLRFLVFFLATWVIAAKSSWLSSRWQKLLFIPAIIVTVFAILQYMALPYDFLKHFGYSSSTITPYETINHNIHRLRVASTLRGANPLGAYLLLPISALGVLLLKDKRQRSDKLMIIFGLLVALAFSFSRSAWIGLLLSLLIIAWLSLRNQKTRNLLLYGLGGLAILVGVLAFALRNNSGFESVLYHTDHTSQIAESSNEGHSAAFKSAGKDIIHEPLGRGVGTAGPESTYNYGHYGRIAENYFMQIGQETGIVGIALLIAILVAVGKALWNRRQDPLALWLLASLVGITFINLLSHAWTDDTLAYLWWGYAAIALAQRAKNT